MLGDKDLIIGGDLNLMTSAREVWGSRSRIDLLSDYFKVLFQSSSLVDVEPVSISPTWKNGRCGEKYVAKILDHFLMSEELIASFDRYRSWVVKYAISDHLPIVLELSNSMENIKYPFKFNPVWLEDLDFVEMVKSHWLSISDCEEISPMRRLVWKLKSLKSTVIAWEK
jgi:hypothetical protein